MESNQLPNEEKNEISKVIDVVKVHRRYIYIISVIIIIFLLRECGNQLHINNLVKNISTYSDSSKHYKDKYGNVISYNKTLQFDNDKQLKNYLSKNDSLSLMLKNFKKVNTVSIIKEKIYIHDTIPITFETKIPCDFKPFDVVKDSIRSKNKPYYFRGTIFPDKFTIDSILIPNTQNIVIGLKKTGFLGLRRENQINVLNSNSFIQTTNTGAYTIKQKPKRIGIGFSVGYGFGLNGNAVRITPFVGASVNYNILNF